ncbi:histone-lysine N-methyltransferase SETDB2 isoform X1 [Mixophyes fleayi]|uniref:histone-lysine N-methyltransferase SETDB2 isoform X1 n=1 Tax=Mixophyes fleayi TaxID=3061075 RepID=UPI003F4DDCBE
MKQSETDAEATGPSPISSVHGNLSVCEAKAFWQNQHAEGKVDLIFEKVQNKLQLLWQKIKDGSATNQEYTRALLWVSEADFDDSETYNCDLNIADELKEDKNCTPAWREEMLSIPINYEFKEKVTCPEAEFSDVTLPLVATSVRFKKHNCAKMCLSEVNPYFTKRENPLKFPIMCQFQRRHAKSGLLSRSLDVLYKAPCGRCLRDFEEVRSYLFQTECRFLFLDHFSFNTYIQLERNPVKSQVVAQEADISGDVESVPVSFCNEIDNTRPSPFTYRKSPWPRGYSINNFTDLFIGCCDCTDGCLDVSTCACLQLTARECNKNITSTKNGVKPGYTYKRLTTPISTGLYECNVSCKCDRKMCQNRVVQHGLQVRLQVYKTKDKGWGVRCLDDLEKGTFVCIYAGRILLKSVDVNAEQDSNVYVMQTDGNKTTSIYSKRKRVSHSDSEINVLPSVSTSNQKHGDSPTVSGCGQPKMSKKSVCSSRGKLDFTSIRRPKTKTSMLQKRRRQLMEEGAVTLQHSSDDDLSTPPASPKLLHFNEPGDKQNDGKRDRRVHTAERDTVQTDEAGYVSDESSSSIRLGVSHLQQSTCREKKVPLDSSLEENENTCILDASKEGNVGRFLNHSCSPNLLVQQVFVETHCKSFPWVAFFTKSIVKAGTELTWEYNYHIGSAPENEIPCLCGHKTCKNITI